MPRTKKIIHTTPKTANKLSVKADASEKLETDKLEIDEMNTTEITEPINPEMLETETEGTDEKPLREGPEKFYEAVGRRKESTARVRVLTKKSSDKQISEDKAIISVNGKPYYDYFPTVRLQNVVEAPLKKLKSINRFKATVQVSGGGSSGQAGAIMFGLSRALVLFDTNFSKKLRKAGYLTRDPRAKERRKYGLKKARKSPQWSKR